ncbi:hypothetical protein NC99_07120 [Sunxiuqinia dokdonensis]|uniref:Uncharacterized protein n=1 Tax=Sunxiuqinia dokdonensis TaxID=1409788 RepID=A0A0L8VE49_9BACT|nr:hypothetical protein NC99_07120 [Sunxiuqinia dokdonensis]
MKGGQKTDKESSCPATAGSGFQPIGVQTLNRVQGDSFW